MSISSVGGRSQVAIQGLVDMRRQLDDLQQQLGTGKKATNYAGLGLDASLAVGVRTQLSALDSYEQTITTIGTRLNVAQGVLTRADELGRSVRSTLVQTFPVKATGQTPAQESARGYLDELLDLLNTRVADRYLFAGRSVDQAPVESAANILDGDGVRAGLKQVIGERLQADVGAGGLGRLLVGGAAGSVSLSEDVAGSPFGFKLAGATTDIPGATITGPTGSPAVLGIALASNPAAGQGVTFALKLPDGSSETIRLTATAAAPPGPNEFTIGVDAVATAANLQTALGTSLGKLAQTALPAASALAAANDFFNIDAANPPRRVAGPPFDTATGFTSGTPANTVFWYRGDTAPDAARGSAVARIDTSITVSYGLRGNEEGLRSLIQNVAAFAGKTFAPSSPDTPAAYAALTQRLGPALMSESGGQRISDIASDLAGVQAAVKATQARHQQTRSTLAGLLDNVEGISTEQVSAQILALQTRLQASLRTTAILYQLNLVNYL
jgi:flagellar hook-associated protein 3 FlgL